MTTMAAACLSVLLLSPGLQSGTDLATMMNDAIQMAHRGEHPRALALFRIIVTRDPRQLEARLWIGRLHLWMGDPDAAEPVFAAVLYEAPASTEALVGMATARLARGDAAGALEMLRRAENLAPDDADILAMLGRALLRLGRQHTSVEYAARAAALTPSAENRGLLEAARRQHGHRLEFSGFVEEFGSGLSRASAGDIAVNVRASDRWRLGGRAQVQHKSGISDARVGGGIEWRPQPAIGLTVNHLAGLDHEILPAADTQAEVSYAGGPLEWVGSVRRMRFPSAQVWVASPGVTIFATERLAVGARYYLAFSAFENALRTARSHSGAVRMSFQVWPRVSVNGGYARGIENFETLTLDRIGQFRADTGAAGVRLDLPSLTSAYAVYEQQRRPGAAMMHRVTLSLVQRF